MKRFSIILSAAFILSGCSTGISTQKYNAHPATPESFVLCHGYSCTSKTPTGFSQKEWSSIKGMFKPPAKTAESERSKIAKAIAQMERYSGAKTGTDEDMAQASSIKSSNKQMDCLDETVNTTMYVGFLQQAGLLKFHEVAEPVHRGYIFDGRWPHNSAVIQEIDNARAMYVVDSFYRENGQEPYIKPRQDWINGWRPPGATQ